MKRKKIIVIAVSFLAFIPIITAQSLSEKKYDLTGTDEQIYSTSHYVEFSDEPGHILVSSTKSGAPPDSKTIIERVKDNGDQVWRLEYDPPGNEPFDKRSLIRSHRAGTDPSTDDMNVLVVGEIEHAGFLKAGYIEIDPTGAGAVLNEVYFDNAYLGLGHMSAISTVESGTHKGAYMVGAIQTPAHGPNVYSPLLVRVGSSNDYAYVYEVAKTGAEDVFYHDVDVEEDGEGYVIAVGHSSGINYVNMIIDVYDPSDGSVLANYKYTLGGSRISSVKSIGGGRVLCGGLYYGLGFVMEVDITNGHVNWARQVNPGALITQGGVAVTAIEDVIEVELDKEGMPIFMGVTQAHLTTQDPVGPGLFARLDNNGVENWAISEEMEGGFADLEPQKNDLGLIASLTGIDDASYTNKLTFADGNLSGFSGCQSEIEFTMDVFVILDPYDGDPYRTKKALIEDEHIPTYGPDNVLPDPGCCWLPYFNPLPWNHPWESTYWPNTEAILDAGTPTSGSYTYDWQVGATREVWDGHSIASATTHITKLCTIPFNGSTNIGGPRPYASSEITYARIYVTDDAGCIGYDATRVHVAEDGIHNIPDYADANNIHENEEYYYCSRGRLEDRNLYEHHGSYLSTNGFTYSPSPNPVSPRNIMNPISGTNWLASTGSHTFWLDLYDTYNDGGTARGVNYIETDLKVGSCGCIPSHSISPVIEEITNNGRKFYSLNLRKLPIVKYSFSLHMDDGGTPITYNYKLIKRNFIRTESSGSTIVKEDHLLPTIDDRYMLNRYPTYAGPQKLYLDVWYYDPLSTTYPYTICGHERIKLDPVTVSRLAGPKGNDDDTQGKEASRLDIQNELIKLYPNPTHGQFDLIGLPKDATIEILDMQGRAIVNFSKSYSSNNTLKIDLTNQDNGMYIVRAKTSEGVIYTEKLIKQ